MSFVISCLHVLSCLIWGNMLKWGIVDYKIMVNENIETGQGGKSGNKLEMGVFEGTQGEVNDILNNTNTLAAEMLRTMNFSGIHSDNQNRIIAMQNFIVENGNRIPDTAFDRFRKEVFATLQFGVEKYLPYFKKNNKVFENCGTMNELLEKHGERAFQIFLENFSEISGDYWNDFALLFTGEHGLEEMIDKS